MGADQLAVYDDDTVADHNIPNQFYREQDLGRHKVTALEEIVRAFTGVAIEPIPARFDQQAVSGVVIVCVDTMDQRRIIWRALRYRSAVPLVIDTRMGAEVAVIHTVQPCDPDDIRRYQETLHGSDEAFQARCTERAIIYTVLGLAAITAGKLKKFVQNEPYRHTVVRDFRLSILQ